MFQIYTVFVRRFKVHIWKVLINLYFFVNTAYFEKEMLKRQQSKESKEDEGIDVDDAIEKLDITEHNPQKYLDILKKSVEGDPDSVLKVTPDNNLASRFKMDTWKNREILSYFVPKHFKYF